MGKKKDKEKKPKPPKVDPRVPPSIPPVDPPPNITRVYAAGGDGPAIVVVDPDPMWVTGTVVIISALEVQGFIALSHPYKVISLGNGEYNLQEEDEEGQACIPWNDNANGNGPNPGIIALRP